MTVYLEPIHPGEILLEDFMRPMEISINKLARGIGVPPGRDPAPLSMVSDPITADTALRLGILPEYHRNCG